MNKGVRWGIVFLIALASNVAWLVEVRSLIGWEGSGWIHYLSYLLAQTSLTTGVASAVALGPFVHVKRFVIFVAVMMALLFAGTYLASNTMIDFVWTWFPQGTKYFLIVCLSWIAVSVGCYFVLHLRFDFVSKWVIASVAGAQLLIPVAAYLTIQLLPAPSAAQNIVQAVKMGYGAFWVTLLFPLALRLGGKKKWSG